MNRIAELLILCHSSGVDQSSGAVDDLALLVARPRESTYQLYAQDWFSHGGFDYGYQWVTRVARDRITGQVRGEGTRLAPFILDSSLRRTV